MIEKILKAQQQNIFGIIQVGANVGQELNILTSHSENVYLFEPLTEAFDLLTNNISEYSDIKIFKLALGDKSEFKKINISNTNFSASSSLLEPSLHLDYFPEIKFDDFEEVEIKRFDEIDYNFKANFLILDVQGYELKVIKGFGDKQINYLNLEHYPGMTEKIINNICSEAKSRWNIEKVRVVHRVGEINVGDQIVFVGVASRHRREAFNACEFIMDYLKKDAPFWKKEFYESGSEWLKNTN